MLRRSLHSSCGEASAALLRIAAAALPVRYRLECHSRMKRNNGPLKDGRTLGKCALISYEGDRGESHRLSPCPCVKYLRFPSLQASETYHKRAWAGFWFLVRRDGRRLHRTKHVPHSYCYWCVPCPR